MQTLISKACKELDIQPIPSQWVFLKTLNPDHLFVHSQNFVPALQTSQPLNSGTWGIIFF
jgi:hypothetical protein